MINLPPEDAKCDTCKEPMPAGAPMCGKHMWHSHNWVCKHPATYTCPVCYPAKTMRCPVCGCPEEYT